MFLDKSKIHVISGKGGDGLVGFRRAKFLPFGGPDGGNGGDGGSVWLEVNPNFNTLLDMGHTRKFKADNGVNGKHNRSTGRNGEDITIKVPPGTLVKNQNGKILADLTAPGQRWKAASGGQGGLGNINFTSSTNQAPDKATPGKPGQEFFYELELKLMADVGLVGFPNAGKSSLVNKISSGRPKIGDYPFTTLAPVLGIVSKGYEGSFVVADIPGLIEGASEGRGLGHRFLKHIERTYSLLFVIDGYEPDAYHKFELLKIELDAFHPELLKKPYCIALNKCDLGASEAVAEFEAKGETVVVTSAVSGQGCPELIAAISAQLPGYTKKGW
jgi:GTP-binding protein